MTSKEIAQLTGKAHTNVIRDIRTMLEELGLTPLSFEHTHVHPQNHQTYAVFILPKDLTLTLVSGYNVVMRHRIVTRWQELEAGVATPVVEQPLVPAIDLQPCPLTEVDT